MIIKTKNIKKRFGSKNSFLRTNVNCFFEIFTTPEKIVSGLATLPAKSNLSTCIGDCDGVIKSEIPFTGTTNNSISFNGFTYFNIDNILYRIDKIGNFSKIIEDSTIRSFAADIVNNELYVIKDESYKLFNNNTPSISIENTYNNFSTEIKYSILDSNSSKVINISSGSTLNYITTFFSGSTNIDTISFEETYLDATYLSGEIVILTINSLLKYNPVDNTVKKITLPNNLNYSKSKIINIEGILHIFNNKIFYKLVNDILFKIFDLDLLTFKSIDYINNLLYVSTNNNVLVLTTEGVLIADTTDNSDFIVSDLVNNYSLFNYRAQNKILISPLDYIENIKGFENGGLVFSGSSQPFSIEYIDSTQDKINFLISPREGESFNFGEVILTTTGNSINNTIKLDILPRNEYIFKSVYNFKSELFFYSGQTFNTLVKNDNNYLEYNNFDKNNDLYLAYVLQAPAINFIGSDTNSFGSGEFSQKIEEYNVSNLNEILLRSIPNGEVIVYQNNSIISTNDYVSYDDGRVIFYTPLTGDVKFVYLSGNVNKNMVSETINLSGITSYSSTTPEDKIYLTGTPTAYVITLDNIIIGLPQIMLNNQLLNFNNDYYLFSNNKILIENQGITTPRTLQIFYQAETTVNVNLSSKLINVSVNTTPFDENGFINFIIKDINDNLIHVETQKWKLGQTIYQFQYNLTKAGTYKYLCENVYVNTLINGNKIFTISKTSEYKTTLSQTIASQIGDFNNIVIDQFVDNTIVSPVIINITNSIGQSLLEAEEFVVPEFVE